MTNRYIELHARSAFSFLEGASLPEAMTQQAANLLLPGLAILDRDGLYGSPRLYRGPVRKRTIEHAKEGLGSAAT